MSEWQDISTAPKDGAIIIVWDADGSCPELVCWDDSYSQWTITAHWGGRLPKAVRDAFSYAALLPTHWMPLPAAPKTGGAA